DPARRAGRHGLGRRPSAGLVPALLRAQAHPHRGPRLHLTSAGHWWPAARSVLKPSEVAPLSSYKAGLPGGVRASCVGTARWAPGTGVSSWFSFTGQPGRVGEPAAAGLSHPLALLGGYKPSGTVGSATGPGWRSTSR